MNSRITRYLALLLVSLAVSGCANVKPWEKSVLAREDMIIGSGAINRSIDDHVYFSKEGTSGGRSFGGGGCGCN